MATVDNFKKMVMHVASACTKTNPLSSTQTSLLERHLDALLPRLRTPDHPPYSAMIQEAIEQLNKEEGSGKELISTFIKKNYNGLPWVHDGMLKHHLNLLCKSNELVQTKDGRYLVSNLSNERSDGPSCIPASTADTRLNVGTSYNSISSLSSSSGSENRSEVLLKESLQQKNDKSLKGNENLGKSEDQIRKGNGKLGKSVKGNENSARRTKSSIWRLGRSSKKDDFLISSEVAAATKHGLMLQEEEKEELNGVASEEYRNTEQPGDDTLGSEDGFEEQKNQKKRGRKRCGKLKLNTERKKTTKMQRGRPPKNVVLQVSKEENCLLKEDKVGVAKDETQSPNNQNVDITKLNVVTGGESEVSKRDKAENNVGDISPPCDKHNTGEVVKQQNIISDGSPDELSEKQNNHIDNVNEVIGSSAGEEVMLDQEDKEGEDNTQIEVLNRHTEATTKNSGRGNISKCKQGANAEEITPVQTLVAGKGSGKSTDMRKNNLAFEEKNTISQEMTADNETTGKVHQVQEGLEFNLQDMSLELQIVTYEQNLPDEVPKRGRGRPPKTKKRVQLKPTGKNDAMKKKGKLQDPSEMGKEVIKRQVQKPTPLPGRKRGRPPKSDTSRQLQMIQEQLKTMEFQNITGQTIEEEKDSRTIIVGGNQVTEQTGISSH